MSGYSIEEPTMNMRSHITQGVRKISHTNDVMYVTTMKIISDGIYRFKYNTTNSLVFWPMKMISFSDDLSTFQRISTIERGLHGKRFSRENRRS